MGKTRIAAELVNNIFVNQSGSTSFTGSLNVSGSSNVIGTLNATSLSGSLNYTNLTSLPTLVSGSEQVVSILNSLNSHSSSIINRASNLESKSASVDISITNINSYTSSNDTKWSNFTIQSSSFAQTNSTNIFSGDQTITGSLFVSANLIVQGSSSIQNISSSVLNIGTNLITVAVNNPSARFGGISVIDSGSNGGSGSLLYDSVQDEFIFVHRGNGANVTSSHFVLGPETIDNIGNETYLTNNRLPKGTGKEHLNDSNITDDGSIVSINSNTRITGSLIVSAGISGSIASTNGVVSGSSQITLSSTTGFGTYINQSVLTSSSPTFAGVTINGKVTSTSTGVDGTFADAFVSQYSSNNSETNAIQTSVSSTAINSGFRFQVSNGGGSSARTTVADFVRSTQTFYGNVVPAANGTQDLGSTGARWSTVYTSDLSLNNGIGDWTIVEGEDDLFLYNNKKGKVYKFALTEVDPSVATPKIS